MASKMRTLRKRMNESRETPWKPIVVHTDHHGGVEKNGMKEIFEQEHMRADGTLDIPEDVVILDPKEGPTPDPNQMEEYKQAFIEKYGEDAWDARL